MAKIEHMSETVLNMFQVSIGTRYFFITVSSAHGSGGFGHTVDYSVYDGPYHRSGSVGITAAEYSEVISAKHDLRTNKLIDILMDIIEENKNGS